MPTIPGTQSQPLTPQQTLEKVTGLISDLADESPAPVPAEIPDTPPETPAATPPETADQPAGDEPRYTVQVDGAPVEVDLEELKAGYRYQAHNTKTAQALAEEKRAFEAEARTVQQERVQYQQGLQQLRQALEQLQGEPDWATLHGQLDPAEFLKRKADWEASKAQTERIKAHEADIARQAADAQAKDHAKYLRAEQDKLVLAIPEWSSPETMQAEHAKLIAHGKTYGFSEPEILAVTDHRAILLLRDAMRYRELHREPGPQAQAKVASIKTAKPGTPARPRPNEAYTKKYEQAAKSGRQRDAMSAIADLLPD